MINEISDEETTVEIAYYCEFPYIHMYIISIVRMMGQTEYIAHLRSVRMGNEKAE